MKATSIDIAVLNSLLFIRDPDLKDIPEMDSQSAVWSTSSCIAVSCLPDSDGETKVTIGPGEQVGLDGEPLFDGWIDTPSKTLIIETVLAEPVLQTYVASDRTRIRIWTDGHPDTEFVVVGVS